MYTENLSILFKKVMYLFLITFFLEQASFAQEQWLLQNQRDYLIEYTDIIKAGQYFITIGSSGKIMSSIDGINWKVLSSHTLSNLKSIATSGSVGVIVGENGTLLNSNDFTNWKICDIRNLTKLSINKVIWNGSSFLAVGDSGIVLSSSDGNNWNLKPTNIKSNLKAIAYCNNIYVAIDEDKTVFTSDEAATWSSQTAYLIANSTLTNVQSENGYFYLTGGEKNYTDLDGGHGHISRSIDGKNWVKELQGENMYGRYFGQVKKIIITDDSVYAVGSYFMHVKEYNKFFDSPQSPWVQKYRYSNTINSFEKSDSDFIIVGNGLIGSTGGHIIQTPIYSMNKIIWTGYNFVTVGDSDQVSYSSDGLLWSNGSNKHTPQRRSLTGVAKADSLLIAVGDMTYAGRSNEIIFSKDSGASWVVLTTLNGGMGSDFTFSKIAFNGTSYISCLKTHVNIRPDTTGPYAYGSFIKVVDSLTGNEAKYIMNVAVHDSLTLVIGDSGKIFYSKDLTTWHLKTSGVTTTLNGVCYDSIVKKWIVVGDSGTVLTSSDGETWISQNSGVTTKLNDITYNDSVAIAVGNTGAILVSNNLIDWKVKNSGTSKALNSIAWNGKLFVAVGQNATVLTSSDEIVFATRQSNERDNSKFSFKHLTDNVVVDIPSEGVLKCSVYDIQGRLLSHRNVSGKIKNQLIDPKITTNGMFIVCLYGQNGKFIKKFCVSKN